MFEDRAAVQRNLSRLSSTRLGEVWEEQKPRPGPSIMAGCDMLAGDTKGSHQAGAGQGMRR